MFKKFQFRSRWFIVLGIFITSAAFAAVNVPLVLDAVNQPGLPKNYRTTNNLSKIPKRISTNGMKDLHAIGSAQFSEKELETVLKANKLPLTIVDLRQESHGFVNGNAVSWYGKHDWANIGKSPAQVEQDQTAMLKTLDVKKSIVVSKILAKNEDDSLELSPVSMNPKQVLSEAEIAKKHKLGYIRIYVTDNWHPMDQEVDRFVEFERNLPKNTTLYFHCRAGKGRTTTFMVMHDMMHNAKKVSFVTIILRQRRLGGINLLHDDEESYKDKLAKARVQFIKDFYQYSASNKDNFKTSWSQWIKARKTDNKN